MTGISLLIASCNNEKRTDETSKSITATPGAESKQERNKKIIIVAMESFMKGDLDGTFKVADTSYTDYADGSMPPIHNVDTIKSFMKSLINSVEGYKGENLKYYADGDYVLVYGDWGGVFKHDLMGMKATGKQVRFKDVDIFKLNDAGKVVEHSSVQNLGAALMTSNMVK